MQLKQFETFFRRYVPFWHGHDKLLQLTFAMFDRNKDQQLDLVDIAPGLSILMKGDFSQRLLCKSLLGHLVQARLID